MTPNPLPPPEISAATPPVWAVASALFFAVLLAAVFTLASLSGLAP